MQQELEESLSYQLPPSPIKIATAISDQELEARVVATAYKNNWQLLKRAVEINEINLSEINFLFISSGTKPPNFSGETIFLNGDENYEEIAGMVNRPISTVIQKFNLTPGIGKNFGIVGIGGGVGTTTLAINLSFELAERNLNIHLVDFDKSTPMIAPYLGLRDLMRSPNKLLSNLLLSQANFNDLHGYQEFLQLQINNGFNLIFDLGQERSTLLPFENIYVTRMDLSSYTRISRLLNQGEITDGSWLVINQRSGSSKKLEEQFLALLEGSPFKRVRTLPNDLKTLDLAENSLSSLIECASGSAIRRAIKELAKEII